MPAFFRYANAIRGSQSSTTGGAPIDYRFAPSGIWSWTGTRTPFVVEEARNNETTFNGDPTNETIDRNLQIGRNRAQTVEVDGTDRQVIWDYTFTVTDGVQTWRVGVIDVDLNNNNTIEAGSENGYFLVFPDGMPPKDTDLTYVDIVENDDGVEHADLGAAVVCFATGTLIETEGGPRPVESLAPSDRVLTRNAGFQPLRWRSETHVIAREVLAPIVISAGVFGNTRDLIVSPQHAVLIRDWRAELLYGTAEVLVRAVDLLSYDGVYRKPGGLVGYHHLLFDRHHLVKAEGLWSESLYPGEIALTTLSEGARTELATLVPDMQSFGIMAAPCLRGFEARCLVQ
jgi:hypothetical protein